MLRLFKRVFGLHAPLSLRVINLYCRCLRVCNLVNVLICYLQEVIADLFYAALVEAGRTGRACKIFEQTRFVLGDFFAKSGRGVNHVDKHG